ncbi:PREDICTED: transcription factor bHLH19-like [Tarenaya hassleriana]|uniref:transcription factor bHLH19-like n=1 Tax=Tarenaya hassleriana TaxID=28532 RepID=UPI00053C9AE3|nr:PREDICTED: transcription factor bHLH19-like [Tarenaya hassleriana]
MEDFFLPEFTFDHFDFDLYEEDLLPEVVTQKSQTNPHARHHVNDQSCRLEFSCERPMKKAKINGWNSSSSSPIVADPLFPSSSPRLISFDCCNVSSRVTRNDFNVEECGGSPTFGQGTTRESARVRSSVLAKEHVLAERKRREMLSERFIALSSLLPGLKKSDKVTVLENAIMHIKELQERVMQLGEEKEASKETESMIFVKKTKIFIEENDDDTTHSSTLSSYEDFNLMLPEIEARVSGEDVLIRIHCKKSKGSMIVLLNEIEKLHLSVLSSIALPFGDSTLDITVLAKKEEDFSMTGKDLVKNLRLAIL